MATIHETIYQWSKPARLSASAANVSRIHEHTIAAHMAHG